MHGLSFAAQPEHDTISVRRIVTSLHKFVERTATVYIINPRHSASRGVKGIMSRRFALMNADLSATTEDSQASPSILNTLRREGLRHHEPRICADERGFSKSMKESNQ